MVRTAAPYISTKIILLLHPPFGDPIRSAKTHQNHPSKATKLLRQKVRDPIVWLPAESKDLFLLPILGSTNTGNSVN